MTCMNERMNQFKKPNYADRYHFNKSCSNEKTKPKQAFNKKPSNGNILKESTYSNKDDFKVSGILT